MIPLTLHITQVSVYILAHQRLNSHSHNKTGKSMESVILLYAIKETINSFGISCNMNNNAFIDVNSSNTSPQLSKMVGLPLILVACLDMLYDCQKESFKTLLVCIMCMMLLSVTEVSYMFGFSSDKITDLWMFALIASVYLLSCKEFLKRNRVKERDENFLLLLLCEGLMFIHDHEVNSYVGGSHIELTLEEITNRVINYTKQYDLITAPKAVSFSVYMIMSIISLGMLIYQTFALAPKVKTFIRHYERIMLLPVALVGCMISFLPETLFTIKPIFGMLCTRFVDVSEWMVAVLMVDHGKRSIICLIWILSMVAFIPFANKISPDLNTTIARKLFHGLAVIMFPIPTILCPHFMLMAFSVAASAFLLVEFLRLASLHQSQNEYGISKLHVNSNYSDVLYRMMNEITLYYSRFLDSRDTADGIIMSHFYLVIGCSIPLLLTELLHDHCEISKDYYQINHHTLEVAAHFGWITVGVGDAIGAIVGIKVGKTKWPGSNKTFEGSIAAVIVMSILSLAFMLAIFDSKLITREDSVHGDRDTLSFDVVTGVLVALSAAVIMEAITNENDNIIMPLISSLILLVTMLCRL